MSDSWNNYVNDSRTVCRYGLKCYQKSPAHHQKFKHPPQHQNKRKGFDDHRDRRPTKIRAHSTEDKNDVHKDPEESTSTGPRQNGKHSDTDAVTVQIKLPETIEYFDSSKLNIHSKITELFSVNMPDDFYKFYNCFKQDDLDFVKLLQQVNLIPVGPFELLLDKMPKLDDKMLYHVHWRFFYDPPEFQTILKSSGKSEFHIGYYRDEPHEKPVFLGSNDSAVDCKIAIMSDNIFGAVYNHLINEKKKSPFTAMACQKLMDKIKKWSEEYGYSILPYNTKKRLGEIQAKTFHGAGIVVPYDKKTQLGYRSLVESYSSIKKLFTRFQASTTQTEKDDVLSELQPVITYANIAVDECDFGTGLECGINLFCSGIKELEPSVESSLCAAYMLLKRDAFSHIIQAHLKYRRKGPNMSVLSFND